MLPRRRRNVGRALALVLGLTAGCSPASDISDAALYAEAIESSQSRLGLPDTVALHPLLAIWPDEAALDVPLTRFNAYDTVSVPGIVEARPEAYRRCMVATTGMCQVPPGEVAVVLSSLRDLNSTGRVLRLVVYDARAGSDAYRDYLVRLKRRWFGGWSVASLTRLD